MANRTTPDNRSQVTGFSGSPSQPKWSTTSAMATSMTAISMPHVQRVIASKRVTSAATVVAIDLEQAFTLASRQRRPDVLACDCPARTYTITDAASGRVYLSRNLGADAALQVDTLSFSTPSVTVYPRGTSSTPMQVTLRGAGSSHRIAMTTAGIVRVID